MTGRFAFHPSGRLERMDRITGYPNPFETYLLIASLAQGIVLALGLGRSPALEVALGALGWLRWIWAGLLGIGGLAALTGLYWPGDPFTAVETKRVGLVMTGFGGLIYAVALGLIGERGLVASLSAFALAVACFVRAYQVTRLLKRAELTVARCRADLESADG